jgi:hypothetical protein
MAKREEPRGKPGYSGYVGRDPNEPAYWGPKTLEGFKDFRPWNKAPALKKTIGDLRKWQQDQYKDEIVLGVNKGPNSEAVRRANSTQSRMTDYSKVLGRLNAQDARRNRNSAAKAAALKASKNK